MSQGNLSTNNVSSTSSSGAFQTTARNSSYIIPGVYDLSIEDTNWVLTSSFIIFTMQTGKSKLFSISQGAVNEKSSLAGCAESSAKVTHFLIFFLNLFVQDLVCLSQDVFQSKMKLTL